MPIGEEYIPRDIITQFHKEYDDYRKYFIKKVYDYLMVDFGVLSVILSFFFVNLTNLSKIYCLILFIFAIIPKWIIITNKLKQFGVPIKKFWEEYDKIEEKAKELDSKDKLVFIKKETEEMYYGSIYNATISTYDYYTKWMNRLNKYISFSLFCVIIVLLNLGKAGLESDPHFKFIINYSFGWISLGLFLFPLIYVFLPEIIKLFKILIKKCSESKEIDADMNDPRKLNETQTLNQIERT